MILNHRPSWNTEKIFISRHYGNTYWQWKKFKKGNIYLIEGKINTKHNNKVQGYELFSNDYKRRFQKQNYNISPVFMQSSMLVLLYWDIFDLTFSTVTHVWIFRSTFFHTFTFITEVFLITTVTTTHCLLKKIKERNILNSLS